MLIFILISFKGTISYIYESSFPVFATPCKRRANAIGLHHPEECYFPVSSELTLAHLGFPVPAALVRWVQLCSSWLWVQSTAAPTDLPLAEKPSWIPHHWLISRRLLVSSASPCALQSASPHFASDGSSTDLILRNTKALTQPLCQTVDICRCWCPSALQNSPLLYFANSLEKHRAGLSS